jgi:hypothetical protein
MTTYTLEPNAKSTLKLSGYSIVSLAKNYHDFVISQNLVFQDNPTTSLVTSQIVASKILEQDSEFPNEISIANTKPKQFLRNFLTFDTSFKSINDYQSFIHSLQQWSAQRNNTEYAIYPKIQYPNKLQFTVIILVSRHMTAKQYSAVLDDVLLQLHVNLTGASLRASKRMNGKIQLPIYSDLTHANMSVFSVTNNSLEITDDWFYQRGLETSETNTIRVQTIAYSREKLDKALELFIKNDQKKDVFSSKQKRDRFWGTVGAALINGQIDQDFYDTLIQSVSSQTTLQKYQTEAQSIHQRLIRRPEFLLQAPNIGEYLQLYLTRNSSNNIAQKLISTLNNEVKPDPEIELSVAGDFIAGVFPPALLDQAGDDIDNVVIFDPINGYWTHDLRIFRSLLNAIKPYSTKFQLETLISEFSVKARNQGRKIVPYSGTEYILFENIVLNTKTNKQYELTDTIVQNLYFIERSKVNVKYVENPPEPIFPETRLDGNDWKPSDYINFFGNNEPEKIEFFYFLLSLGLFGNHSSGVHVNIKGDSGIGKTTLKEIFMKLQNKRVEFAQFSTLNERFFFTSYKMDSSVIWLNENNIGIKPLDDVYGIPAYDSLADLEARFQAKNKGDIVIMNPPQMYVDGTSVIRANETNTGPARRTIVFKIPSMTKELQDQFYVHDIDELLKNDFVAQWLVHKMIQAFQKFVPMKRRENFRMNLSTKEDVNILPDFAKKWRKEVTKAVTPLDAFADEEILPFLSTNPVEPTIMHIDVLYELYLRYHKDVDPTDKFFNRAKNKDELLTDFLNILERNEYRTEDVGSVDARRKGARPRKRVDSLTSIRFDWDGYKEAYVVPQALKNFPDMEVSGKLRAGWFAIVPIFNAISG